MMFWGTPVEFVQMLLRDAWQRIRGRK